MKFTSSLKNKLIYVFRINDNQHKGCLKIGEATVSDDIALWDLAPNSKLLNEAAKKRINQYTQTAGISYDLLYTELTSYSKGGKIETFSDSEVHKILTRSGIEKKIFDQTNQANEWYITDLETVKNAIKAVKDGLESLGNSQKSNDKNPVVFRPEQIEAIEKTKKQFRKGNEMLWNAKMRFGKTLSALQVVKEMDFTRTLILTHRPVVDAGWFEDFGKIITGSSKIGYGSKTKGNSFETLEKLCKKDKSKYVYFASMQDLRGSAQVGGNFNKNNEVFSALWDFIIIDEAHEGTQTELGKNVLSELKKDSTKVLQLSGTPFNLLDNYKEEEIYTWDYVMEQRAKDEWDRIHFGDPNPYSALPKLNIYTYDLGKLLSEFIDEEVAFNFREFFRVNQQGEFLHKKDVLSFLNLICKSDQDSNYPYSTEEYRNNFRHSLWMVPGVKEARALSSLLKTHSVFGQFEIINVAGDGDEEEENEEALKKVMKAISDKPHETYTITLSCGRLTTGVSVPAWTAVFMLSGSYSTAASSYMQTIFRVQTPATINGRIKEDCFVFDFAPDRTLKVIAETAKISARAGKTSSGDRQTMGEFLNFCPIIAVDGSRMRTYNVEGMLEQLKKVYVERVVRNGFEDVYLYNDQLMKLDSIELKEFEKLKGIIGTTKAMPKSGDININNLGFTDEQYEDLEGVQKKKKAKNELTEEEKALLKEREEKRKNRDSAISILRGISIRMPLLIYGADVKDEETQITLDSFTDLIDEKSWEEYMPKGVSKQVFEDFKKYYEPDVFRAAGKRIREMARASDLLSIEDRIVRITNIFSTFRNPDKETVLTPWRVVNMHVSDCIGGYVFFNENFSDSIEKPRFVDRTGISSNIYDIDSKILEINSKSGLYPLFMAYGIYRNYLTAKYSSQINSLTINKQYEIWDKILEENIFVLCKTPMAKSITKRTLCGFRNSKVNTRYFEDLVNQITNKQQNFINKVCQGKSYWKTNNNDNMKFNAIIGNPPYQEMDGGAGVSAKPIYNLFIDIAKKMKPNYISMISPSRWFAGGKGLDDFRAEMLNDKRLAKIVDFINAKDCFPNTSIGGGINYFLWDSNHNDYCDYTYVLDGKRDSMRRKLNQFPVFIRYNKAVSIIEKIRKKDFNSFSDIVSSRNPFGFSSNTRGKSASFNASVKLFSSEGVSYVKSSEISGNNNLINSYKVMISKVTSEHAGEPDKNGMFRVISRTEILAPNEACTDSYLLIGNFNNTEEVNSLFRYLKTKFLRFLLLQAVTSINLSKEKFDFIPIQDFSNKSDVNWSKTLAEIDSNLYKKYELTKDEIDFIEKMIKPIV